MEVLVNHFWQRRRSERRDYPAQRSARFNIRVLQTQTDSGSLTQRTCPVAIWSLTFLLPRLELPLRETLHLSKLLTVQAFQRNASNWGRPM
jgi:hypothetical protein